MKLRVLTALVSVATASTVAQAQLTISNGGFETGLFSPWTTSGNAQIIDNTFDYPPFAGLHSAEIDTDTGAVTSASTLETFLGLATGAIIGHASGGTGTFNEGSAMRQTSLTVGAGDIGKSITFKWNLITQLDPSFSPSSKDYAFASLTSTTPGAAQLFLKLSDLHSLSTPLHDDNTGGVFSYSTGWQTGTMTLTTAGTYTLGFGIVDIDTGGATPGLMIDSVSVVPEPGQWAMVIGGVLGAGCILRQVRRRVAA